MLLKDVIEALVFASHKPLSIREITAALRAAAHDVETEATVALAKTKDAEVATLLQELRVEYDQQNRAFRLVEQASGWTMVTRSDYGIWVRQLYPESRPTRLSGPSLETLAVIAYRQPVTRADIEAVRGVAVDGVMQSLLDRGLIRIAGRADLPGRPLLYETTQVFMEHFGLKRLEELPNSMELRRMQPPPAKAGSKKKNAGEPSEPAEPPATAAAESPDQPEPAPDTSPGVEPSPSLNEETEFEDGEFEREASTESFPDIGDPATELDTAFEADYGNDFDPELHGNIDEESEGDEPDEPFPM